MNPTKIDYAEYTWNPVWGCRNSCEYCYARATAKRFGQSFEPHWREKNFNRPMPKEPSIIFVNSMSDIVWWKANWAIKVFARIEKNPEHIFLFLTKCTAIYSSSVWKLARMDNVWLGFTATNTEEMVNRQAEMEGMERVWCSAEPLLGHIETIDSSVVKWLVVGAMTGPEAKPMPETWLSTRVDRSIPMFFKRNVQHYWDKHGLGELVQQYPREMLDHLGR